MVPHHERPPPLPARARRASRLRGRWRALLPRQPRLGPGRLPRRRHVLRAERLPDHDVAAARASRHRRHRAPRVLDQACSAPPPGALPAHRARRRVRRGRRRAGGAAHDQIRHARDARVRRELAVRLQRELVLRPVPDTVAAPARLVPGDRGAVLPDLADDRVRRPAAGGTDRRARSASSPAACSPDRSR